MCMEKHLDNRPKKTIYSIDRINNLVVQAEFEIKKFLLPNPNILKIFLIGSSVKGLFGKYEAPGFRGSLYSDFDFIVFVKDGYTIPVDLVFQEDAKPFSKLSWNLAYREKDFIENKYDVEIFFIRESLLNNDLYQEEAELAGIPLNDKSAHNYKVVYKA